MMQQRIVGAGAAPLLGADARDFASCEIATPALFDSRHPWLRKKLQAAPNNGAAPTWPRRWGITGLQCGRRQGFVAGAMGLNLALESGRGYYG